MRPETRFTSRSQRSCNHSNPVYVRGSVKSARIAVLILIAAGLAMAQTRRDRWAVVLQDAPVADVVTSAREVRTAAAVSRLAKIDPGRQGGDWLLQVLLHLFFGERQSGGEVGDLVAQWNHFLTEAIRKLAYGKPREVGWRRHGRWLFSSYQYCNRANPACPEPDARAEAGVE